MKISAFALTLLSTVVLASPSVADVAGVWRISGKVSAFAFTLNCTFKPEGSKLGGVCVDASTNDPKVNTGKAHILTAGVVNGAAISWTYQSSFLFSKFDVTYSGTLDGDRMSGTIDAQGRKGVFTAVRS